MKKLLYIAMALSLTLAAACASGSGEKPEGASDGALVVDLGGDATELEAVSFGGRTQLAEDGTFWSLLPQTYSQLVVVQTLADEDMRALAYVFPTETGNPALDRFTADASGVQVDEFSTALALTMINPLFFGADQDDKLMIASHAVETREYNELVSVLETVYAHDPDNALDNMSHPEVYLAAHDASMATYSTILERSGAAEAKADMVPSDGAAWIDAGSGQNMVFRNPKMIYYGAGYYDASGNMVGSEELLQGKEKIIEFDFDLSSFSLDIGLTDARETATTAPAGWHEVRIFKGIQFDMSVTTLWNTPPARLALLGNTWQTIVMAVALAGDVGLLPDAGIGTDILFGILENTDFEVIYAIYNAIGTGDVMTIINSFVDFISANAGTLASSITGGDGTEDPDATASIFGSVGEIAGIATGIFNAVNVELPFFYDLITADQRATYHVDGGQVLATSPSLVEDNSHWYDPVVDGANAAADAIEGAVESAGGGCVAAPAKADVDPIFVLLLIVPALGLLRRRVRA